MAIFIRIWAVDFLMCIAVSAVLLKVRSPALARLRQSRTASLWKWQMGITVSGIVVPWITALAVWIVLLADGKPVVALGDAVAFLFPGRFVMATVVFSMPFVVLANVSRSLLKRSVAVDPAGKVFEKKVVLFMGLAGGAIATAALCCGLWQDFYEAFDMIVLGFPYVIACNSVGIAAGLAAAWIAIAVARMTGTGTG